MGLHLFEGFGIELEYMVVDRRVLDVRPVVDYVLQVASGNLSGDHDDGAIAWSNELALHVVELKTNGPAPSLRGVAAQFHESARRMDAILEPMGARLLPGGMHPWMDPEREFRRWPHAYGDVYDAYDRIFDTRGHGWSNLQSCHLNLPFQGDDEFGRLHLAIRALLPLLPALSAASPFMNGKMTGWLDTRLDVYRQNQRAVPRIAGLVVPEPVTTREEYHDVILRPIWRDIAPHDPDGILQFEWLNSRGAIARFDRDAIEIRVLDCQESPFCDLAICALTVAVLRALTEERWATLQNLRSLPTEELAEVFWAVARDGERAVVRHRGLLSALGFSRPQGTAQEVWRQLADVALPDAGAVDPSLSRPLQMILERGPLARRMIAAAGAQPDRRMLTTILGGLADCLVPGTDPVFMA
jgi:gamma-glutamyl:cysteine ligase YbdK (ATP-grasp superfamily)